MLFVIYLHRRPIYSQTLKNVKNISFSTALVTMIELGGTTGEKLFCGDCKAPISQLEYNINNIIQMLLFSCYLKNRPIKYA